MKIKILKTGTLIKNILLFIVMSLFFHHVLIAIYGNDLIFTTNTSTFSKILALFSVVVLLSVYKVRKISHILLSLFSFSIISHVVILLFSDFDKLIIVMLFVYSIISYYFVTFLASEIKESFYLPLYSSEEIKTWPALKIKAVLNFDNTSLDGYLTNWNENGCFIRIEKRIEKIPKNLTIKLQIDDIFFYERANIVSYAKDHSGIGIMFIYNKDASDNEMFTWDEFYSILRARGILPNEISNN